MTKEKDEFSTFDAMRILNIDRSRFVHWMRGEFIPSGRPKPWGRGFKTVYSLYDLYSTALFKGCVDFSLSREVSKRFMNYVDWNEVIEKDHRFLFVHERKHRDELKHRPYYLLRDLKGLENRLFGRRGFLIDLKIIMDRVNRAVELDKQSK